MKPVADSAGARHVSAPLLRVKSTMNAPDPVAHPLLTSPDEPGLVDNPIPDSTIPMPGDEDTAEDTEEELADEADTF